MIYSQFNILVIVVIVVFHVYYCSWSVKLWMDYTLVFFLILKVPNFSSLNRVCWELAAIQRRQPQWSVSIEECWYLVMHQPIHNASRKSPFQLQICCQTLIFSFWRVKKGKYLNRWWADQYLELLKDWAGIFATHNLSYKHYE